jgi:hypothetical protein
MPIKSFRGQLADGAQQTIRLSTKNGMTGYRIKKFTCIATTPGVGGGHESVVKLYKVPQDTVNGTVDFRDATLLGVSYYTDQAAPTYNAQQMIIFDNDLFNQDIYITNADVDSTEPINYYIELEQVPLNQNAQSVATLRDIRANQD